MYIKTTDAKIIRLPGGCVAESVGRVVGIFKLKGEEQGYLREFEVLHNCIHNVVLGRSFLDLTNTFTSFCHRIVESVRPCLQRGRRLFLLGDSTHQSLNCKANGIDASAFPDTGSELMLISGEFARRNSFKVHRGRKFRKQVELINGSIILTDGMVLDAKLQFDALLTQSQPLQYDRYLDFALGLSSLISPKTEPARNGTFICDLHVIEDLPCDIILSNEFVFQHQLFKHQSLFHSAKAEIGVPGRMTLEDGFLFMRKVRKKSRLSWRRQTNQNDTTACESSKNLRSKR